MRELKRSASTNFEEASIDLSLSESRVILVLRILVLFVLFAASVLGATWVYMYTDGEEADDFHTQFKNDALKVIESFHRHVEQNIGAVAWLSTSITSFALHGNLTFPFVTLPDFELRGSHLREQSGSHVVHWLPLVTDDDRETWEKYAMEERQHIDVAFRNDMIYRTQQDEMFSSVPGASRKLEEELELTVLDDGTGYHPRIWRNAAVLEEGNEPNGTGPYLVAWQRSPIGGNQQSLLNLNFVHTKVLLPGVLQTIQNENAMVMNGVAIPIQKFKKQLEANLRLSQYRQDMDEFIDGLTTFMTYPVFDSFGANRSVAGVLATNVYWNILFSNLLPSNSRGVMCVVSNSLNQTFTYRIDGPEATYQGWGDLHDKNFNYLGVSKNINQHLMDRAGPQTRSYMTAPLSNKTVYTVSIYPSSETEKRFVSKEPRTYLLGVVFAGAFASALFVIFSFLVEIRQNKMVGTILENSRRATAAERELNEFLAHEVRNPLSAAITAASFVSSAVNETEPLAKVERRKEARHDIEVVMSSLHFINDFLRSMLDNNRATGLFIELDQAPADVLHDILRPVASMLRLRNAGYDVIIDCPPNMIVSTDAMRLKQVVMNLARNATKFVEQGFVRLRANTVDQHARIYVEDSGPGISAEKIQSLFAKYQSSLDLLNQGTGVGLSLSKKLMELMNGDLWLDQSYHSGITGSPGACFVVQLNAPILDVETSLPSERAEEVHQTQASEDTNLAQHQTVIQAEPGDIDKSGSTDNSDVVEVLPDGISVLFVDDDAVLRKLFCRAVKKLVPSWTTQEASSGETALDLCESKNFDLIFIDQYMASVDKQLLGTETVMNMRSRGVKSIICGLSANHIRDQFIESGANAFVLKPIPCKADDLRQTLLTILAARIAPEHIV